MHLLFMRGIVRFIFFNGWYHSGEYLKEGRASNIDMLFGGLAQPGGKFEELGGHGNLWGNELMNLNSARIITLKRNDENIYHSKEGDAHYLSC